MHGSMNGRLGAPSPRRSGLRGAIRRHAWLLLAWAVLAAFCPSVFAQTGSRVIVNGDLEFGVATGSGAMMDTDFGFGATFDGGANASNPWFTSHPTQAGQCSAAFGVVGVCHPVETWGSNNNPDLTGPVAANTGTNFVELNAFVGSMIYQNVCLVADDTLTYRFAHRRRVLGGSGNNPDSAAFRIKDQANGLVQTVTTSSVTGSSWAIRTGTATLGAGVSGILRLGFEAITTSSGNIAAGNLLDSISISLRPLVDLGGSASSGAQAEGQDLGDIFIRINGTSQAGGTVIALQRIAPLNGDATALDSDFVLAVGAGASMSHAAGSDLWLITIPAGAEFDGGVAPGAAGATNPPDGISIDVDALTDALIEPRESFRFRIVDPSVSGSSNNWLSRAPTCSTQTTVTPDFVITGQSQVRLAKISDGAIGGFNFTFGNADTDLLAAGTQTAAAIATSASGTAAFHDADAGAAGAQGSAVVAPGAAVTIAETIPPGWVLTSATCVDAANAPVAGISLSGGTLTIPGAATAAGASLTCTFRNGRSPIVRLGKRLPNGRFAAADQFVLSIAPPGTGAATFTTTGSGDVASGQAVVDPAVAGTTYTLSETATAGADLGNYAISYACTNANAAGSAGPSGAAATFELVPAAGDDFTCTFANTRNPLSDLAITKTNTPAAGATDQAGDVVTRETAMVYRIVVTNHGPDAVSGALVRDPASPGLDCTAATCAGAACPGSVTVAALQGAGVALGALANGASVNFDLTCTMQ